MDQSMSVHSKTMTGEMENHDHQYQQADQGEENFNSKTCGAVGLPFYSLPLLLFA